MAEMILFPLFAVLIGMTLLEFYVVIKVGEAIGVLPTLAIMVVDALIGSALMRSQGRAVWRRMREALAAGRPPAREVLDGALVVAGGAFLITPGFVTDVIGALLLIPPTRAVVRRMIVRHFTGRLLGGLAAPRRSRVAETRWGADPHGHDQASAARGGDPPAAADPFGNRAHGRRTGGARDDDVEGTAVEIDRPEPRP